MPRRIRCALLTTLSHDWLAGFARACPGLECLSLSPSALGLAEVPNPFALPEDDRADAVLLTRNWYDWAVARDSTALDEILRTLERRGGLVIGLDDGDDFALGFPPEALERIAAVIKPQGLYRDRELYNYLLGPYYPGALWTEKVRPRATPYRSSDLEKLRLSVPCFLRELPPLRRQARMREAKTGGTIGRAMSRPERVGRDLAEEVLVRVLSLAPVGGRPLEVHCAVGLTHVQRIEVMRLLEGFSGKWGFSWIAEPFAGTKHGWTLTDQARDEVIAQAMPYMRPRMSRTRYLLEMCRHRVSVAPTGYGELTFRHGEAWRTGTALLCQDVSHAEMMFPLEDRENVAFCRPDLSDLPSKVRELLADEPLRRRIARQGRATFTAWAARWREHLYNGIEAHVRNALSSDSAPLQQPVGVAGLNDSARQR